MEKRKILIVEDDPDISNLLDRILTKGGYETMRAYSGSEAELRVKLESPDLILLDLMLPGIGGEELIRLIREKLALDMPILIVSAKTALESKVHAISLGADDYITKPFEPAEVLIRVQAALRRYHGTAAGQDQRHYVHRDLSVDPVSRRAALKGVELTLTGHEFDILYHLSRSPDTVYSRARLYELVWKNGYYGEDNTVNVHVSNLRKKLAAVAPEEEYIKTVWGIGFKMG